MSELKDRKHFHCLKCNWLSFYSYGIDQGEGFVNCCPNCGDKNDFTGKHMKFITMRVSDFKEYLKKDALSFEPKIKLNPKSKPVSFDEKKLNEFRKFCKGE